ncbi:MAG: type II toxin-antitoxin system RelE/ParE family toxin [Candidatus Nomurabacteria bacterium]
MVTKIVKFLKKLSGKDRNIIENLVISIRSKEWENLDIKKLQGNTNIFRVRKGEIRIIFSVDGEVISLIDIDKRSDKTYKRL